MEAALADYLKPRLAATGEVRVSHLLRIPGGASRETWMFKATWADDGGRQSQEFILRKDPPASLLDTDRAAEYAFYSAFAGSSVPVPAMRWLERDASLLGGPFFIMERIGGCDSSQQAIVQPKYQAVAHTIAEEMYRILASIARFEWQRTAIVDHVQAPSANECWRIELDRWEQAIDDNELSPQPIARAAIRWLRANPPPPAQCISVVHGDYRVGNFLYTSGGQIKGILDWEMAHLGDPLEDLAWSFNESWQWAGDGRAGGIVTIEEACRLWTAHSGLKVDPAALHWWRLLTDVKCQGIWLTGTRTFQEGRSRELILPLISYTLVNAQDQAMLRAMGRWTP